MESSATRKRGSRLTLLAARAPFVILIALAQVLVLVGFVSLVYSAMRWMRTGEWETVSTWPIAHWFYRGDWLDAPQSWLGIHKLVAGFLRWPLFGSTWTLGLVLLWVASKVEDIHDQSMYPEEEAERP